MATDRLGAAVLERSEAAIDERPHEAGPSLLRLVEAAIPASEAGGDRWSVDAHADPARPWIRVGHADAMVPAQGWKLHVSAGIPTAGETLRRALPVLVGEAAAFKVAASVDALGALNGGEGGASQVGKFITVYPTDDAQAVRLAVALDAATRGLRGPAIPSDRRLAPDSLVHYRYGGFGDRHMQTPLGEVLPALETPDGGLVPDRRLPIYQAPPWAVDPFVAAGVAEPEAARTPLIAGRFLITATLHATPRGTIHLAVDIVEARSCILKRARRGAHLRADGGDARDALRHEAAVLARLAPDRRFPAPIALVEQDGDLYLAMEDVEGVSLERHVGGLAVRGRFVPGERVVAWGRELAGALGAVHAAGFAYHDLKSTNVIVTPEGRLRLIDFELAHELAAGGPGSGRGTRGYMSPQQTAKAAPTPADDVYGLGVLLGFVATGAEPSQAPRPDAPLGRPLALLNPAIDPDLAATIARCVDPDPAARYPTMAALDAALAALDAALAALGDGGGVAPPAFGAEAAAGTEAEERAHAREMARQLGDTLARAARPSPTGNGLVWASTHRVAGGLVARDVNTGGAGAVLALAELVGEFADPALRDCLAGGTRGLLALPRPAGDPLPGLYVGEAGIGAALLRSGQVLADRALIEAAAARGRSIATLPHRSPDLFNGTAGRLRFHLLLWDETGDRDHLDHAVAAGEVLLATAEDTGAARLRWTIPPGYDGLSGQANLGYAHGAAGIADALLDLFEATGDGSFREAARGAARWLAGLVEPSLEEGDGATWPDNEGQGPAAPFWCHGATGIGRFFLHVADHDLVPGAADLAARAGRAVARGARWAGPTQCHGLAGNLEFLLDLFQATGDRAYLAEARSLARLLLAFARERDGSLVFPSENPTVVSPDYMVGFAGVAVCLLRLADPDHRPHQLGRRGFRWGVGDARAEGTMPQGHGPEVPTTHAMTADLQAPSGGFRSVSPEL